MRKEALTWDDVETLIDHLLPQLEGDFQVLLMITRGGIVPGGMLAEALQITQVLTAAVDFPATMELQAKNLMSWPNFMQFPADDLLRAKRVLIVDDVWGSGRTVTAVKNRAAVAGAIPFSCVLHFNPYRNLFKPAEPDYYGATTDAYIVYPWEMDRDRDFSVGGWGLQR
jgi:hypoxanthine phosphoribosyltransferase